MRGLQLRAVLCVRRGAAVENVGSLWVAGKGIPPVFCKRVRKLLIVKTLAKHSFLKSAQEFENEEFSFALFVQKSEKSEGAAGDTEEV
jgi:hypothetical protein